MEARKLKSLLRFYKKRDTEIELKVNLKGGFILKGRIVKLNCIFRKYLVFQSSNRAQMKIFFEDIIGESIIPIDFVSGEDKKNSNPKKNRSLLSPKLRFEVLKRDKYVCQYCGACGPNVELEIDHIIPVSRGGKDDKDNLKTACIDCNRGKGVSV